MAVLVGGDAVPHAPDVTGRLLTSGVGEDEVAVAPILLEQDQVPQEGRVVAVSIM